MPYITCKHQGCQIRYFIVNIGDNTTYLPVDINMATYSTVDIGDNTKHLPLDISEVTCLTGYIGGNATYLYIRLVGHTIK
jgi:hypothetical protein